MIGPAALAALSSMSFSVLQRLSSATFSLGRRLAERLGGWVRSRPALAAWVYPEEPTAETRYREFNGRYFANFHEQERMLADKPRMDFYRAAINRHIQPGDRVVDLGTGTGILAALASRRGAAQVYAIDHSPILDQARTLAEHNGVKRIEFIATHSKEFTVNERVDVILHEQMGDCLFDEAMVANVTDLRDRVLRPGGLILPSRFEFYCEPIKIRDGRLVPFLWELNVQGYDYSCLERSRPQDPGYYHLCSSDLGLVEHFLGEPEPALMLDLGTVTGAGLPQELHFSRRVVHAGRLDGYAVFFRARVDDDLVLSSSPLDPRRAPHWGFRILRTDRDDFELGDVIEVTLRVGAWHELDSWRWSHVKRMAAGPHSAEPVGTPGVGSS